MRLIELRGNLIMQVNFKKWIALFTLNHAYSFLFGMCGAMLVLFITTEMRPSQKQIATVNITQIIKQFTNIEAKKTLSDEVLRQETKIFGQRLEQTLKQFSHNHNLILFPTEAVIAGCDDYTQLVMQAMMDK